MSDEILTEEKLAARLKEWMSKTSDPITKQIQNTVGEIQLVKEQYGNITLDEAIEKLSRIVLTRLIKENTKESKENA